MSVSRFLISGLALAAFVFGCGKNPPQTKPTPEPAPPVTRNETPVPVSEPESTENKSLATQPKDAAEDTAEDKPVEVKPFSEQDREELLGRRFRGGMQYSFRQFANMFLVTSHLDLGVGIGLMTSSPEIAKIDLQSPFPEFYHPTVREFLDAIALQTISEWKYDPTNKFIKSSVEIKKPLEGPMIFEFTKRAREKPFEVTLADGWKSDDKGHWLMLIPPSFPVGMDIYEMGTYSAADPADEAELFKKVRAEVALEWAQRVYKEAETGDLTPAKVGDYDALYFEKLLGANQGKPIRWRQWVFMVGNKCYFIVSTIVPQLDDEIFPDVEKMLKSFRAL